MSPEQVPDEEVRVLVDAVVLAGGAGRRLGGPSGTDKPARVVGGTTLLERAVEACAAARSVVVVGPPRDGLRRRVRWTREHPPGTGPLAALDAGVAALGGPPADVVVLLAADLPAVTAGVVERLLAALADHPAPEAACLVDPEGRRQPLLGAYRLGPLRRALAAAAPVAGGSIGRAVAVLTTVEVADAGAGTWPAWRDVDTAEDLAAARAAAAGCEARPPEPGGPTEDAMQEYVRRLAAALELDPDAVDVRAVLDLARDAAHAVERPAAPVTTYLAGLAAGLAGGSAADAERAVGTATRIATEWGSGPPPPA